MHANRREISHERRERFILHFIADDALEPRWMDRRAAKRKERREDERPADAHRDDRRSERKSREPAFVLKLPEPLPSFAGRTEEDV